ncbi:MAG: gamma-glutamylcyclotransferase [Halieaceae bacterium]|jgi:cation transport regulator ChaC|nr:gamma-glutamylcyclotransferase [Halieaceae bacterium]
MADASHWVFGYGSLIYKVDFPYLQREAASLHGWARRFWQGSHDHRGTPEAPGRVVTLVPAPGERCRGVAYRIEEGVFDHLDHREKNGYERHLCPIWLERQEETVDGLFYIATADNPAFLGDAPAQEIARHVGSSHGPSGSNADYLLRLAAALREQNEYDEHVMTLEAELLRQFPHLAQQRA